MTRCVAFSPERGKTCYTTSQDRGTSEDGLVKLRSWYVRWQKNILRFGGVGWAQWDLLLVTSAIFLEVWSLFGFCTSSTYQTDFQPSLKDRLRLWRISLSGRHSALLVQPHQDGEIDSKYTFSAQTFFKHVHRRTAASCSWWRHLKLLRLNPCQTPQFKIGRNPLGAGLKPGWCFWCPIPFYLGWRHALPHTLWQCLEVFPAKYLTVGWLTL